MSNEEMIVDASETTLNEAPLRASKFLLGVNTEPRLRMQLAQVGYDQEAHAEGWWLLHAYDEAGAPTHGSLALVDINTSDESTRRTAAAQNELDSMDEKWFAIGAAVLELAFPTQYALLFDGIAPAKGAAATSSWAAFTPRYRAMQKGDAKREKPEATKAKKDKGAKKDKAAKKVAAPAGDVDEGPTDADALAALARHGFNDALVTRVEGLVKDATALGATPVSAEEAEREEEARQVRRDKARRAVYAWIRKWARIAPRVVTRRDWLITLGLAERRKKEKSE